MSDPPVVDPEGRPIVVVRALTDDAVRSIVPPAAKARAQCTTCTAIGAYASRTTRGAETYGSIPDAVRDLRELLRLGEQIAGEWVEICTECGGLYVVERGYEYLATGSEDTEAYARLEVEGLVARARSSSPNAQLRGYADGTWSIVHDPTTNRRQRR